MPGPEQTEIGETMATGEIESAAAGSLAVAVAVGESLGGYRIDRRLGAGGMGEVFAATRLSDGETVALKVLGRASPTHLYRFKREFRALADVEHQNLVHLHELVVPREGPAFFTMELIDGEPFDRHVRGRAKTTLPNLGRLERALRQLVAGIDQLHAVGVVHRDLKPSNVLVDHSGRVVILDFGLVSTVETLDEGVTHDGQLLGTPAYMAPEQAMSGKAGPAADCYALGVMLYECLTGQRPFVGSAMRVMMAKADGEIPDPGSVVASVPAAMRSLTMKLLARDPQQRPSSAELQALLGEASVSSTGSGVGVPLGPSARAGKAARASASSVFVGREAELGRLDDALRDVRETRAAVTLLIHGGSGCGKSALVRRFTTALRERARPTLILSGRCLERESVPYKGVDAVVDALSVHLRRLPPIEAAALQPRHVAAMTKLFPVLDEVWEHGAAALGGPSFDSMQQRRLGLAAMRELIVRLCDRAPLVVCIDDFQWADIDSVRLLASLLRPPEAPALLLILSFREPIGEDAPSAALRELRDPLTLQGRDVRELELGPLTQAQAQALAAALLELEGADPVRAEAIARRARGNPLAITQLALGDESGTSAELELDTILARRIAELGPTARRLLAFVALAGGPVMRLAVLEAFATDAETRVDSRPGASDEDQIDALIELGLVTRTRRRREDSTSSGSPVLDADDQLLELAHGRVRALVCDTLEPQALADLHLQLGAALERLGADTQHLAEHFAQAGERERAAAYAERGAIEAAEALAFGRAVDLYRQTIALLPEDANDARRRSLEIELVEQLINLGHTSAAADELIELAATAEPAVAAGYRRRAVVQLARCGRIDEAVAITGELLDALGEPMPRGQLGSIRMFLRERLRLLLRGERFVVREPDELPAAQLARLDTLIAVATGLSIHEVILTQALGARALRLAFEAGEPRRLALLLSYRFLVFGAVGQFARASRHAAESREVAALADDLEVDRSIDLSEAVVEWFRPRVTKAKQLFGRLVSLSEDEPTPDWVRAFATIRYCEICMLTGALAEFRRIYPGFVVGARERGNLFELASLEAIAAVIAVYYDELDEAERHLAAARECWQPSRYTYTCITVDIATTAVMIHGRRFDDASAHLDRVSAQMRSSGLIHMRAVGEIVSSLYSRYAITRLLEAPSDRALLKRARRTSRPGRGTREPLRVGDSIIHRAALCTLAGDIPGARLRWREALQHCERHDMHGHLAALRLRLASVTGGREAREYDALGHAYLAEQGVRGVAPFVDTFVPAHGGYPEPGS